MTYFSKKTYHRCLIGPKLASGGEKVGETCFMEGGGGVNKLTDVSKYMS